MHEFELLKRHAGRNALLDLKVSGDSAPQPVMLHAVQENPLTRHPIHVDLLAVNLQEERTIDVSISMVGQSAAVDKQGGTLLHLRDAVSVRAKPDDLPSSIELDVTPLETFDDVLHVSDLIIPAGVTLVTEPSEPIARVQPPRVEEEPTVVSAEEELAAEAAETGEPSEAAPGAAAETAGNEDASEG